MEHWRSVLPIPILELRYEDLVTDTEDHTRRLLRHCGLEWDAACLTFQHHDRPIQTPSHWHGPASDLPHLGGTLASLREADGAADPAVASRRGVCGRRLSTRGPLGLSIETL